MLKTGSIPVRAAIFDKYHMEKMINHAYISLYVKKKLSKKDSNLWFKTVESLLPFGTHSNAYITVDDHIKLTDHYVKRTKNGFKYIVPLTRDLLDDEAGIIAIAFDRKFDNENFEINFSQTKQQIQRKHVQQISILDEIATQIAKKIHNEWLKEKTEDGWNYGPMYNPIQKKNPRLRNWDQLNQDVKLEEINRALKMLTVLDSINLKIVQK